MRKRRFVLMFSEEDRFAIESILWSMEKYAEELVKAKQEFNNLLDQKLTLAEGLKALKELYKVLDASVDIELLKYDVRDLMKKLEKKLEKQKKEAG
jgi:uncharacterized protein (DUF3084 family)